MASIEIALPRWLEHKLAQAASWSSLEDKMELAAALAEQNVREQTGGPFGAAVFCGSNLVAAGVNLVVDSGYSMAHAEVVALSAAQQANGSFDLGTGEYELVTSVEPCAMCLGATIWSGVRHVVIGARGQDAEAIGFDEGPKPADWVGALQTRGITVTRDVLRERARQVLLDYAASGAPIYNASR